jgi:hypothetical protein
VTQKRKEENKVKRYILLGGGSLTKATTFQNMGTIVKNTLTLLEGKDKDGKIYII